MIPEQLRLLVVDDVEANRYILALWLRRAGYHVIEARTGREALQHVEKHALDLVLLDVNLPDMTGYDVCQTIKGNPRTAVIPVLHVSASAVETADRTEGLRRGAEGYLVEPVEREELLATVEALLRASISQRTATRLAGKLRMLNEAALAINESTSLESLVSEIAQNASNLFNDTVAAALAIDGEAFVASCAHGGKPVRAMRPAAQLEAALSDVFERADVPMDRIAAVVPANAPLPDGKLAIMPLDPRRELCGALLLPESSLAAEEDPAVLAQFLRGIAAAVRSMRVHSLERGIAVTLQQAILPQALPRIPGLDAAVRYAAGSVHAEVGGDFYDLFSLDDERVVFAIGDVMGHSIEAATIMAQIRTAFRSYALEGHMPDAIVTRLNQLLLRFHSDTTATVCCGALNVRTGRCVLANAGHLPALRIAPDRTPELIGAGASLLGVLGPAPEATSFVLAPEETLVLYTDGLVERRGESIDEGLARLVAIADGARNVSAGTLCERLLSMVDIHSLSDDIALLAMRRAYPG
ncbi:MAG TPA: SpoIIE family protein phosphatase [Candidatus Baltobacteraceae bacterium]|nr:SpoIIE family protein phosphatase [Candidatus Baltobacteraceae bacterium]